MLNPILTIYSNISNLIQIINIYLFFREKEVDSLSYNYLGADIQDASSKI